MSRSRAGEHGEKTNQTLHTERVGLIKTFHTGGEREREGERDKEDMCWCLCVQCVSVFGEGGVVIILSLDTMS